MPRVASSLIERLDDQFTLDDVGSTLLEELAKGLYQPEEIVREYIQNAVDAHRLWKYESGSPADGPVQVEVRGDTLSIIDYGIGMDDKDIRKVKAIAVSPKRSADVDLTGHKGVGVWAGLSFFESLSIYSTKGGNDRGYDLTIHFKNIVDAIKEDKSIGEVLNPNYYIDVYKENADEHFTYITLKNPVRREEFFLDPDQVRRAVQRSCPCKLDPSFGFHDKVEQWYEQNGFEHFDIEVDGVPVFRSYPSSVESFETGDITLNDKTVARFWRAMNKKNGVLEPTGDQLIGFRLFQNGFILGGMNIYSDDQQHLDPINVADYLRWYTGEIHVVLPDLHPDLPRNKFEGSEIARQFVNRLRQWYQEIERISRLTSEVRNRRNDYDEYIQKISKCEETNMPFNIDELLKWKAKIYSQNARVNAAKGKKTVDYRISALRIIKGDRAAALAKIEKALADAAPSGVTPDSSEDNETQSEIAAGLSDAEETEQKALDAAHVIPKSLAKKEPPIAGSTLKPVIAQPRLAINDEYLIEDEDEASIAGNGYDPVVVEPLRDTVLGLLVEILEKELPGQVERQRVILDTLTHRLNLLIRHG